MLRHSFQPAWWCKNPHLQTLVPYFTRFRPRIHFQRERVELSDGDFVDVDWAGNGRQITLVLHGLEGCSRSHYVRGITARLIDADHTVAVMHFRGCSGEPNRLARRYHAGDTGDCASVVNAIQRRFPGRPVNAIGYSLGGNVLLKWLGECGERSPLQRAAAVCVPLDLNAVANRMQQGLSRLYQWRLIGLMRSKIQVKCKTIPCPIDLSKLNRWRTFHQFDHHVTAPLHGFDSVDDYYRRASAKPYLSHIRTPTLLVMSEDDPLVGNNILPENTFFSDCIKRVITEYGGHVGFVSGRWPWRVEHWLDDRLGEWFERQV